MLTYHTRRALPAFPTRRSSDLEMTIDYAAGMADAATGGVKINYIPREGGNTVRGSFFATGVNSSFQADNFSDDLRARGLTDRKSTRLNSTHLVISYACFYLKKN